MSVFGNILEKLGFDRRGEQAARGAAAAKAASAQQAGPSPSAGAASQGGIAKQASAAPRPAPAPSASASSAEGRPAAPGTAAISPVDVMSKLESMAAANPQKLNWRTSIVDLLKLLGLDSSIEARKELATELGCPPEKMSDSAQMNTWLHKTVLQKLAESGGNVPQELLH